MVPEAPVVETEHGRGAEGDGWFVLNARDAPWWQRQGLGRYCLLEGEPPFAQAGVRIAVLQPGEPNGMYHAEAGQEDFLVVAGECTLVIEGQERRLRQWDFVHCPPWTRHIFVGAGDGPCVIVMAGARVEGGGLSYPPDEAAARHGASVEQETPEPSEAYAPYPSRWLDRAEVELPGGS